jgi:hypothetical protein
MLNKKIAGAPWCCLSASAWFSSVKLLFVVLILMPTLIHASPQSQPTLQIISPTPKTVVNPGQTVTVSVTSPTPGAFSGVELTGDDPLGFVGTVSVLPAQIPVTIPLSRIDCGSYFLTVSGTPTSGQGPVSAIVELDVERSDFPLTISAALSPIIFDSAGEQIRLDLLAGFADGTTFSVNASSYVTYSSSNTAVATVDSTGLVKAVGPGSGSVTVTYALGSNNNEIFVPVSVPCVSGLSGRGTPSGQAPAKIDVTWTEIPIAVSYNVLRGTVTGGRYTLLGNAVLPAFSDTNGLVNGGTYDYVVQPINSALGVICQSNEAAIAIHNQPRLPELP